MKPLDCRSILLALALAATLASPSRAQSPSGGTMSATGRDFDARKVQKLGAMNADLLCERLFDSADPAAMLFELASIVGPSVMLGKFSELAGQSSRGPEEAV